MKAVIKFLSSLLKEKVVKTVHYEREDVFMQISFLFGC